MQWISLGSGAKAKVSRVKWEQCVAEIVCGIESEAHNLRKLPIESWECCPLSDRKVEPMPRPSKKIADDIRKFIQDEEEWIEECGERTAEDVRFHLALAAVLSDRLNDAVGAQSIEHLICGSMFVRAAEEVIKRSTGFVKATRSKWISDAAEEVARRTAAASLMITIRDFEGLPKKASVEYVYCMQLLVEMCALRIAAVERSFRDFRKRWRKSS